MKNPKALLLVGSAKPEGHSASETLGSYLMARLAEQGFDIETAYVQRALRTPARTGHLLQAVDEAAVFVLAFPLYVDTLPYLVTAVLERIAAHRQATLPAGEPLFLALANCGFPEASHNEVALAICRQFAAAARLRWAGGLARGGGQPLGGRQLEEAGGMARDAIPALELAAAALTVGQPIPAEAVSLMARPMIPPRLYTIAGDFGWRQQAWRNGVYRQLRAKPYAGPARPITTVRRSLKACPQYREDDVFISGSKPEGR